MTRVIIALTTFKRPKMLYACLASLANLDIPEECTVDIIVVDNDQDSPSKDIITAVQKTAPAALHYFIEATKGIPYARNRALDEAIKLGCDWLAFIDDDETVAKDWLTNLLYAARTYNADVVHGRVIYQYPEGDRWAYLSEKNLTHKQKSDGKIVNSAATNNVLINSHIFSADGFSLRFDTTLQFSGGSDTDFFNRSRLNGARLVYYSKAIVYETVPAERCTLNWLFNREARIAAAAVYIDKKNLGASLAKNKHLKRITQHILQAPAPLLSALLLIFFKREKAKEKFLKAYLKIGSAYGRYLGIRGKLLTPYKKVDGH
jgi:succinoglycan biosynthesis protein ExoM